MSTSWHYDLLLPDAAIEGMQATVKRLDDVTPKIDQHMQQASQEIGKRVNKALDEYQGQPPIRGVTDKPTKAKADELEPPKGNELPGAKNQNSTSDFNIDKLEVSDIPSFSSGKFNEWFDSRTPDELSELYQKQSFKNKISDGLRGSGGNHEFLMVVEAPQWSKWGVSARQVQEDFAIPISTLNESLAKGWKHVTGIKGSRAPNSKKVHNQLQKIIKRSESLDDFKNNIREWAEMWIEGGYNSLPKGFHK